MKKFFLPLLFILFTTYTSNAQNSILVNIQVLPPYSPYLSTYVDQPNKILLTLTNTTTQLQRVRLVVKLTGDNGISAVTKSGYSPPTSIDIPAGQTKPINLADFDNRNYFDPGNIDLVGITRAAIIQNQALPEGNYTICVRAYDFVTGQPLSMDQPMGCSPSFPISYIDPPLAIQPLCGSTITPLVPQNIIFTWTPPATAAGIIQYEFTLKEVPNTMNPMDVIKNNVFPVLYAVTQQGNNTLVYTNALPQLEVNKKYVWRVRAVAPNNSVSFKNQGFSEPCWFTYGVAQVPDAPSALSSIKLMSPANGGITDIIKSSSVSGMPDHYRFEWKAPTPVPGVPLMAYQLRIAIVLPGQTVAQALKVDSQVNVLSTEGDTKYNYMKYTDFKAGSTYAWEVKGISNVPQGPEKYFSDQWTFKVKKSYETYKVSGNLYYSYNLPKSVSFIYSPPKVGASFGSNLGLLQGQVPSGVSTSTIAGPGNFPYANKKINFYKAVVIKENNNSGVSIDGTGFMVLEKAFTGSSSVMDAGQFVGSTTTDANGHFEVNVDAILGNVMDTTIKGTTYHYVKVLKLSVQDDISLTGLENPYVNNPDEYLVVDGNKKEVQKDFYARVKSYRLDVTFKELPKKDYYNKPTPTEQLPKDLIIYVLRKPRYFINPSSPASFPKNEGYKESSASETITVNGQTYDVIAKRDAKTNIPCKFTDLVVNDMDFINDRIYVYAKLSGDNRVIMNPVKYRTGDWTTGYSGNLELTYQSSSDWELRYNNGIYDRKLTIVPDLMVNTSISGNIKGRYAKALPAGDTPNNIPDFPLPNVKLLLKAFYLIKTGNQEKIATNLPASITSKYGNSDIFDVTWADGSGNFKFDFNVYSDSSSQSTKIGFLQNYGGGQLYRVLRVVVTNPFYYSPDNSFVVDGGYEYEVGELTANVCEVRAEGRLVEEWTQGQAAWKPIPNQRVKLVMYGTGNLYPKVYGDKSSVIEPTIKDDAGDVYTVVSETTTKSDGTFSFNRLVAHGDGNSIIDDVSFYLYVEPDEISSNNFKTPYALVFPTGFSYNWGGSGKKFNSEQPSYIPTTNYEYFEAKPLLPTIRGAIHPLSNMGYTTLADAHVYCMRIPESKKYVLDYLQSDATAQGLTFSDMCAVYGIGGMVNWFGWSIHKEQITGEDGKFVFKNLPTKAFMTGEKFYYLVYVEKAGFLYEARKAFGGAQPKKGQQESMMLDLRLPITVKTKLVDAETGLGVKSKVIVGKNYSWAQSYASNCSIFACEQHINLKCPLGKVTVYIFPENMDAYIPDSAVLDVKYGPNNEYIIPQITVRPRMHDIDFMVYDKATNALLPYMGAELKNATVNSFKGSNCTNNGGEPTMLKNHVGHATFNSTATKFDFIVYGKDINGYPYVPKKVVVNSNPQTYVAWKEVEVKLDRGFVLTGKVKNGNVPVAGAHIYVDETQLSTPVETYTAADGSFTLRGVPHLNAIKIFCAKSVGNFIGDFAYTTFYSAQTTKGIKLFPGVYAYTHDFSVTECTTMDISKLAGFSIEVVKLTLDAQSGGGKIWGNIITPPSNSVIAAEGSQHLAFSEVAVKPGNANGPSGKPICIAASYPVSTDEYGIDVKVFDAYFGKVYGNPFLYQGIQLDNEAYLTPGSGSGPGDISAPITLTRGVIKGYFSINQSSFTKGAKFTTDIAAWPKGSNPDEWYAAFTSDKSTPKGAQGFRIGKYNGQNLLFNLFNRYPGAEAISDKSLLTKDELTLNTVLHTKLNYVDAPDINLNVGDIILKPKSVLTPAAGIGEIKIPLGKWSLSSTDWQCKESGGLIIKNGTVNTGISVPMKNMSVTYTDLLYGEPQLNNVSLAGIVNLQMEPGIIKSFGFDKGIGTGAWSFVMLPAEGKNFCAKFGNLPGMTGSSQFKVASVRSYSNGYPNKIMLVNDNSDVTIHQIATFSPGTLDAGADNIIMKGAINFGIPQLKYNDNFTLKWIKENGSTKVMFEEPGAMTLQTKGVLCKFPATSARILFADNKLELNGTMEDENASLKNYLFNVQLKRTTVGTTITTTGTANKFYYTAANKNRGIEKVAGAMATTGGAWSNFKFDGDLFSVPAEKGVKDSEKKVSMEIKGDVVAQPGNKVGVEGASTPFGNMNFVYDFNQGALVGSSHIDAVTGNQNISMDLEMMMGSGKWYFFGSGKVNFPPDFWISEAAAASFIGRVNTFPPTITAKFKEFSVTGTLPATMSGSGFTGLAAAAGIKMPIPKVPQFNLSLGPFGSAGLNHEIKANVLTALNFDGSPTFAFNVNGSVYLKVYAGASVGVGCVHAEGQVNAPVEVNGCISVAPVSAALSGSIWVDVSASGEVGVGCCDSDCDHPWYCPCVKAGAGFCLQTSAHMSYNTNGDKDLKFGGFEFNTSCQPRTPYPIITCGN
ncbi:MAG: hypothetical protein IPN22_02260 [Bacteroidetes bacterium]|nr:hypothetical protein [Bacteroidota bacterium]